MQSGKSCMKCQTSQYPNWAFTALWWWPPVRQHQWNQSRAPLNQFVNVQNSFSCCHADNFVAVINEGHFFDWRLKRWMPFLYILKVQFLNSVKVNCFVHAPIRSRWHGANILLTYCCLYSHSDIHTTIFLMVFHSFSLSCYCYFSPTWLWFQRKKYDVKIRQVLWGVRFPSCTAG